MSKLKAIVVLSGVALVSAAVATELRKPSAERTWHGRVGGVVPYDFRPPTVERVRQRVWEPDQPALTPHVFGVGWTVNFGRIARQLGVA